MKKSKVVIFSFILIGLILSVVENSSFAFSTDFRRRDFMLNGLLVKPPGETRFGTEAELNWTVMFINAATTLRWINGATGLSLNAFIGISWGSFLQMQIGLSQLLETKARLSLDIPFSEISSGFSQNFGFKLLAEGTEVKNQSQNNLVLGLGLSHRL